MMGVLKLLSALLLLSLLPPGLSTVVNQFSDVPDCIKFFLEKKTPDIPGILDDGNVKDQNRYKPICQFFNNVYRFATLYDTTNKIPVFSAYIYTGTDGNRVKRPAWKIEPQLNDSHAGKDMIANANNFTNQAANKEYEKQNNIDRGHLFPFCYGRDADIKKSTNTLTNAVPQYSKFNRDKWRTMEGRVKKLIEDECKGNNNNISAHLLTGAVPSNPEVKMNSVNIPSFMWTAFCCYSSKQNKWIAEAHWGENKEKDGQTQKLTLEDLEKRIFFYLIKKNGKKINKANVKLFPVQCYSKRQRTNNSNSNGRAPKKAKTVKRDVEDENEDDEYECVEM